MSATPLLRSFRLIFNRRVAVLLLLGGFISTGTLYAAVFIDAGIKSYRDMGQGVESGGDFPVFYAGAETIVSNPAHAYEKPVMIDSILKVHGLEEWPPEDELAQLAYYNPPFYLLFLAPLTLLDVQLAYVLLVTVNLAALAGLVYLLVRILHGQRRLTLLFVAGLFSFIPLYVAVYNTQPTIFIALFIMTAFLAVEAKKDLWAAVLLAFTGIKPQWLILPGLALIRTRPRTLSPLALASGVLLLAPFLVLGFGVLADYVSLITSRADVDLARPSYSVNLYNWPGFFQALTGSTQPAGSLFLSGVTLVGFVAVLRHGDRHLTWAAAIFTTLVITPHVHGHEWVVAFPAAAFLLSRPMASQYRAVTMTLLLTSHFGLTASVLAFQSITEGGSFVYWFVPEATILVLWCAALPFLEKRQARPAAEVAGAYPSLAT